MNKIHKKIVFLARENCNKTKRDRMFYACFCGAGDDHVNVNESMATAISKGEMEELRAKMVRESKHENKYANYRDGALMPYETEEEAQENDRSLINTPFYRGYISLDFREKYPEIISIMEPQQHKEAQ